MNFKLALAAAAVVGLAGTAQAADLGKKAPAAADYVKVCDAFGTGFFYVPGTDTCLQIGGFVWAQYGVYGASTLYGPIGAMAYGSGRTRNAISTGARWNLHFDARTNTEMGLLRSYIEVQQLIGSQPYAQSIAGVVTGTDVQKAFIQFGGLTAGRATSMFDFYTGDHLSSIFETAHSDSNINLLAYTFSFGNGITATASVEDPTTSNTLRRWAPAAGPYAGVKVPDIVGNVNIAQTWGSAQIMAAAHQNYSSVLVAGGADADKMGFAVGAGAKINLPMLGASDTFAIQAAYSKGALSYVSPDWYFGQDFFTDGVSAIGQTRAWAIASGFTHGWTKTVSSSFTGSYARYDEPAAFGAVDYRQIDLGGNVAWTPVTGLTMTTEIEYKKVDFSAASALPDVHAVVGFLRVRRDF